MLLSFKSKDDFISQAVIDMERKRLLELVKLADLMKAAGKDATNKAVREVYGTHIYKHPIRKGFVSKGEC
jgi:hypothetical protein